MPQQAATSIENNFKNGLVTEATGLNFPENACTETFNCEFTLTGAVRRRLGFDFEAEYSTKGINRSNSVVNTYLWKNVSGNGDITVLAVQVGLVIHFYEVIADASYSAGEVVTTVTLTPVSGAVDSQIYEAQFSDGNGFLFVTHPHCEPVRISYDITTHTAAGVPMSIGIRDFEGSKNDPYATSERPVTTLAALNKDHLYNLFNQGWTLTNLIAWDTAQTTLPSNADVMWAFKDSANNFDFSNASIARITAGNSPAPKGHIVFGAFDQDREGSTGLAGVYSPSTGYQRPNTSAFFAGRIFYSGVNYVGYNSKIYFSQIVESDAQYAACYQVNDPTAEDLFDLLPSDGGVITIPDAGTIHKLVTTTTGICAFAENGVWFITGSSGIGFRANDYSVLKISNIPTISGTSFVNVGGFPVWWNARGIYMMTSGKGQITVDPANNSVQTQQSLPDIKSLTDQSIKSFFADIPISSKKYARGVYHYLDNHIRWIYRSTSTNNLTEIYEYDRVLNLNLITGAFYPWTITPSNVKINAIVISDVTSGNISIDNVVDGSDDVVDDSSNQVIAFSSSGSESSPFDKYLVSYWDGATYQFTFADKINSSYLDWLQYDLVERSFDSYLVTGYKVRGQGIRKFQNNWIRVFSDLTEGDTTSYYFQGIWDYANSDTSGRFSTNQLVEHDDSRYDVVSKRLKVRGHGLALQFKVTSVEQQPFEIIGWSAMESGNQSP